MNTAADLCLKSAAHWEQLAADAERMAAWNRERGLDLSEPGSSVGDHRARSYRAAAASLRLEAETGTPHCPCHLVPLDLCPRKGNR